MTFDLRVINGDLTLNNGTITILTGRDKLIQDILKVCLTEQGVNIYAPWYGSSISRSVIGANLDPDVSIDVAKSQIQNSLENLKKLQELQMADGTQKVQPDELIAAIKEVSVNRNARDQRLIDVKVKVLSKAFNTVEATFRISNF